MSSDPFVGMVARLYCRWCHTWALHDLEADGRRCRDCEQFTRTLGTCGRRTPEWGDGRDVREMTDSAENGHERRIPQ